MYPTCLEADECWPGLLECHGISLFVPILFRQLVFPCSYLIGGTIPTSLLILVETIFSPLVSVLFMECQLHIMKIKSLILETYEPHACKLSLQVLCVNVFYIMFAVCILMVK